MNRVADGFFKFCRDKGVEFERVCENKYIIAEEVVKGISAKFYIHFRNTIALYVKIVDEKYKRLGKDVINDLGSEFEYDKVDLFTVRIEAEDTCAIFEKISSAVEKLFRCLVKKSSISENPNKKVHKKNIVRQFEAGNTVVYLTRDMYEKITKKSAALWIANFLFFIEHYAIEERISVKCMAENLDTGVFYPYLEEKQVTILTSLDEIFQAFGIEFIDRIKVTEDLYSIFLDVPENWENFELFIDGKNQDSVVFRVGGNEGLERIEYTKKRFSLFSEFLNEAFVKATAAYHSLQIDPE